MSDDREVSIFNTDGHKKESNTGLLGPLPIELFFYILGFLNPFYLIQVSQVSKTWYQLIQDICKTNFVQEILKTYSYFWQHFPIFTIIGKSSDGKSIDQTQKYVDRVIMKIEQQDLASSTKSYYEMTKQVRNFFEGLQKSPETLYFLIKCWNLNQNAINVDLILIEELFEEIADEELMLYVKSHTKVYKFSDFEMELIEAILSCYPLMRHIKTENLLIFGRRASYKKILQWAQQSPVCFIDRMNPKELIQFTESAEIKTTTAMAILTRSVIMQRSVEEGGFSDGDIIRIAKNLVASDIEEVVVNPFFLERIQKNIQILMDLAEANEISFPYRILGSVGAVRLLSLDQLTKIVIMADRQQAINNLVQSVEALQDTPEKKEFTPLQIQQIRAHYYTTTKEYDTLINKLPMKEVAVDSAESCMQDADLQDYDGDNFIATEELLREERFGLTTDEESDKDFLEEEYQNRNGDDQYVNEENNTNNFAQYSNSQPGLPEQQNQDKGNIDRQIMLAYNFRVICLAAKLEHKKAQENVVASKNQLISHTSEAGHKETNNSQASVPNVQNGTKGLPNNSNVFISNALGAPPPQNSEIIPKAPKITSLPIQTPAATSSRWNKKWIILTVLFVLLGFLGLLTGVGALLEFPLAMTMVGALVLESIGLNAFMVEIASMALGGIFLLSSLAILSIKTGCLGCCCLAQSDEEKAQDNLITQPTKGTNPQLAPKFTPKPEYPIVEYSTTAETNQEATSTENNKSPSA